MVTAYAGRAPTHQETESAFSAFLSFLCTPAADCQKSTPESTPIGNFGGSGLTGLINDDDDSHDLLLATDFVDRCDENYLSRVQLNCGPNDDWFSVEDCIKEYN